MSKAIEEKIRNDRLKLVQQFQDVSQPLLYTESLKDFLIQYYNANEDMMIQRGFKNVADFTREIIIQFAKKLFDRNVQQIAYLEQDALQIVKCDGCGEPYKQYVNIIPCNHFICLSCVEKLLESDTGIYLCPVCKRVICSVCKSTKMDEVIQQLKIRCTQSDCSWIGQLKQLNDHIASHIKEQRDDSAEMLGSTMNQFLFNLKTEASAFKVEAVRFEMCEQVNKGHPYYMYWFQITAEDNIMITITKRFNDFKRLQRALCFEELPRPMKWWYFGGSKSQFAAWRLKKLRKWLEQLLQNQQQRRRVETIQFLKDGVTRVSAAGSALDQ